MTTEELKRLIGLHKIWLDDARAGQRINLAKANLEGADLSKADLSSSVGIIAVYVPGMSERGYYVYAVQHDTGIMIKAGCWWGTIDAFRSRVIKEKGKNSTYIFVCDMIDQVWN